MNLIDKFILSGTAILKKKKIILFTLKRKFLMLKVN